MSNHNEAAVLAAWRAVHTRSRLVDREAIVPLRQWLAQATNPHAALLSGQPLAAPADDQSARELEALILARHAARELTLTDLGQQLNLLHRVGKRLRKNGVQIAATWVSAIIRPPPSPFPSNTAGASYKVELWRAALERLITADLEGADPHRLWALIALASVLHGALLDRAKLIRLRLVLERGQQLLDGASGVEHAYVEFLLPFQGLGNHHLQRWYVDPISELLLQRLPRAARMPSFKDTRELIREALVDGGVDKKMLPKNMTELLECSKVWWAARGAPVDFHAMLRTFASHDLTTRCWSRLKGWPQVPEPGAVVNAGPGERRTPLHGETEAELFTVAAAEHEWLNDLQDMLEGDKLASARHAVEQYEALIDSDDYRKPYIGWLLHALSAPPKNPEFAA